MGSLKLYEENGFLGPPNNAERILKSLQLIFFPEVSLDGNLRETTVVSCNQAQMKKVNCKGDRTPDRPHDNDHFISP